MDGDPRKLRIPGMMKLLLKEETFQRLILKEKESLIKDIRLSVMKLIECGPEDNRHNSLSDTQRNDPPCHTSQTIDTSSSCTQNPCSVSHESPPSSSRKEQRAQQIASGYILSQHMDGSVSGASPSDYSTVRSSKNQTFTDKEKSSSPKKIGNGSQTPNKAVSDEQEEFLKMYEIKQMSPETLSYFD